MPQIRALNRELLIYEIGEKALDQFLGKYITVHFASYFDKSKLVSYFFIKNLNLV